MKAAKRKHSTLVTQILAASAASWAALWLALVMTPTGTVPFFDHTYELMISSFERPGGANFLVQRIVELLGLLPAAVLLLAAQAHRQHRQDDVRLPSI